MRSPRQKPKSWLYVLAKESWPLALIRRSAGFSVRMEFHASMSMHSETRQSDRSQVHTASSMKLFVDLS